MNALFVVAQRCGIRMGGMHILTVAGRRSGRPRSTPVSVMKHDGARYIVGGFPHADWVRNVRAAGLGVLASGRRRAQVTLVELSAEQARPVLRAFPSAVPSGVSMMRDLGLVAEGSADEFEALAGRCPVFRIEAATDQQ